MKFETSAFLPMSSQNQWHRYQLDVTPEQEAAILAKREELGEEASRSGQYGKLRAWERRICRKYSKQN